MNLLVPLYRTVIGLLLLAGSVVLQVYLSSRKSKWPGLALPALAFVLSLVMLLQVQVIVQSPNTPDMLRLRLGFLLENNISTLVLLAVYGACRFRNKRRTQLEKMSVQDL